MPIHAHFIQLAILTNKVGQIDLVFGVQSRFISSSTHARLQVCVQRLRFVPPWLTSDLDTQIDGQTDSILIRLYE